MNPALDAHQLHFAFALTFHYIFPQLTMGLALLLVYLEARRCAQGTSTTRRCASGRGSSAQTSRWVS